MWSREWPTEPGHYWFYGWPYKGEKEGGRKPELNHVRVIQASNGVIVIRSGYGWYKNEWSGFEEFTKAILPELPDLSYIPDTMT